MAAEVPGNLESCVGSKCRFSKRDVPVLCKFTRSGPADDESKGVPIIVVSRTVGDSNEVLTMAVDGHVQLLLLWSVGYRGDYSSRARRLQGSRHVGETEPVPWAP